MRIHTDTSNMAFVTDPVQTGNGMSRRDFVAGLAALGVGIAGGLGTWGNEALAHAGLPPEVTDAVTHRAYDSIKEWTAWLRRNSVQGYFGETGWPNAQDGPRDDLEEWNALGEKVYSWLDDADVWATYWNAGLTQSGGIWKAYGPRSLDVRYADRVIGTPYQQATVVERHPSYGNVKRGVNTNGGELHLGMSDAQFSNQNSGVYGQAYVYPNRESLAYLAGRGHRVIRLPFRWERVQPTIGGPLDDTEIARIQGCLDAAESVGLKVILDCHNYAAYAFSDNYFRIGTTRVTLESFADLWRRLSLVFGRIPTVAGYDLMNEPQSMPGGAAQWERASQAAVNAVRKVGDGTRVMVAGYHKRDGIAGGGVFAFVANHPTAWIKDPARRTRYTTHAYWGHYGYSWTYDESNANFARNGYGISA